MRSTRIVTSFIMYGKRILILKRSSSVRSMKGLWAGVSGIIERNEDPLKRAKIEIFEEVGIPEDRLALINSADQMTVSSPQYRNHEWRIFPFLFEARSPAIRLNWENSEFKWIGIDELDNYRTVPSLQRVLLSLL